MRLEFIELCHQFYNLTIYLLQYPSRYIAVRCLALSLAFQQSNSQIGKYNNKGKGKHMANYYNCLSGKFRYVTLLTALGVSTWSIAMSANAAIISDSSEYQIRRIANSANGNTVTTPLATNYAAADNNLANDMTEYVFASRTVAGDTLQGLIQQKQREFEQSRQSQLSIDERSQVRSQGRRSTYAAPYSAGITIDTLDFKRWLNANPYRAEQVANYQRYLSAQVGAYNVPPMEQLLTTARSWEECGYEPYQLPPQYLWQNMVPTLKLYSVLKQQGVLPSGTVIRSVYRSPDLNQCAGGASSSKHMSNGAIDIWVPEFENDLWRIQTMQDSLCEFWLYQGVSYNFGLGLYPTGSIHIDTQGHRKWGGNYASSRSSCRF